jgi:hypothetical protein
MTYDYSAFKDETPKLGDNALAAMSKLVQDLAHAEARLAKLEQELLEEKEKIRHLKENQLPTLLEGVGMTKFETADYEVSLKDDIQAGISAENESAAFAWLEENGHENLIKRQFVIDFGKDEETWAKKFQADLAKRKKKLNTKTKRIVHNQTLKAFVRETMAEGTAIPLTLFGVHRRKVASVKIK